MNSEKKLKLISEQSFDYEVKEKDGAAWIEGVFALIDKLNENNRIYPRDVFEKSLKMYTEKFIKNRNAVGELGHPDTAEINPSRISHVIPEELHIEGNTVVGRAKILKEIAYGQIAYNLLKEGVRLGISTRGLGSLRPIQESEGEPVYEVEEYMLIAFDLVINPSSGHFVNGILESKEFVLKENGAIIEIPKSGFYRRPRKIEPVDLLTFVEFAIKT